MRKSSLQSRSGGGRTGGHSNLYAYAAADPVNWRDPNGAQALPVLAPPPALPVGPLPFITAAGGAANTNGVAAIGLTGGGSVLAATGGAALAAVGGGILAAAVMEMGAENPPADEGILEGGVEGRDPCAGAAKGPALEIGKQGKHIPGHNNYIPGRSPFTHKDPQGLLDKFAGKGDPVGNVPRGQPGFKERVDFGEVIGEVGGNPTTNGLIHYSKYGAHIVPANP